MNTRSDTAPILGWKGGYEIVPTQDDFLIREKPWGGWPAQTIARRDTMAEAAMKLAELERRCD